MTKCKQVEINIKTGVKSVKEVELNLELPIREKTDQEKLIDYAKDKGWI